MSDSFFSTLDQNWKGYNSLRNKYKEAIPLPSHKSYIDPIHSINALTTLAIRPIEKPLWLGLNSVAFGLYTAINLVLSVVLAPCALALMIIAPRSEISESVSSGFKLAFAQTIVSALMTVIAALAAVAACIGNPLSVVTRAANTVIDRVVPHSDTTFGV